MLILFLASAGALLAEVVRAGRPIDPNREHLKLENLNIES